MASYTTWAKVVELYPRAADVEADSADQTALITAYSGLFHSFIRHIHKADLTSPYDTAVSEAVALLIVDHLRRRAQTDDDERAVTVEYEHYKGITTPEGAAAHATIDSIRRGALVLAQDDSEHDLHYPEVIATSGNTSVGTVQVYLPHEYKSDRSDTIRIVCSTSGRVDDGTAAFSWYLNYNATAVGSGIACSDDWTHLQNELYIRFVDTALTSNSFVATDSWTVTVKPSTNPARASGPRQADVYTS